MAWHPIPRLAMGFFWDRTPPRVAPDPPPSCGTRPTRRLTPHPPQLPPPLAWHPTHLLAPPPRLAWHTRRVPSRSG